jgi:hypothetical protein
MSDRFDALALPQRDPYVALPYGPGYGMPPPPDEPPVLWRLTRRHWKLLLACVLLSLGIAYLAGKFLAKPLWQAEATLLYQPIAFPDVKQKAAYEHPPSLPTLAGWVKEPALLRQIIDEFNLGVSEEALADTFIKVEQPASTESIVVDFKWPDPAVATRALGRLLDLYVEYVVTTRKEAVVLRIEKMDQQAAYACEDDIKRFGVQIVALEQKLAQTGKLSDDDLDGSMLARQGTLREDIRKNGQKLRQLKSELTFNRGNLAVMEPLVRQNAEPRAKLEALENQIAQLELQIRDAEESIDDANEELRMLPIVLTKAKRMDRVRELKYLKEQLQQHEKARAFIGKPGGPPALGALVGMDAHEFSIKSAPRVGDKPASSSRKTLFAVTFLGLMAAAFGLLFVYDRRHPSAERPRMVYVTPPPGGATLNGADVHRLSARIHQWVRENHGPIVTPPPVTIKPDSHVENGESPPTTNGDADTDLLAQRMQQWLGDGHGPG